MTNDKTNSFFDYFIIAIDTSFQLEGQLRNVDLVHEQLKLAIDNCSKQQRLWQSEKQDLMKKNAELDLTKFSDRTKIYELQIEVNRMKRMADISSSERGSKMSGLESYTFERHEDSSSFSLDDNREPSKVSQFFLFCSCFCASRFTIAKCYFFQLFC